jgi:hypothetical protein
MPETKIMKEIDFIPEWYTTGRKRRLNYHRQYAVMIGIFTIMVGWSFVTSRTISKAKAQVDGVDKSLAVGISLAREYNKLRFSFAQLVKKEQVLEKLNPKVDISNIIAELSFLIDGDIILGKLDIQTEPFHSGSGSDKSTVQLNYGGDNSKGSMPYENRRIKVLIAGIAAGAAEVATLISRLEGSPYFCRIIPGFSRNKKVNDVEATEFEISCYVADYIEHKVKDS